MDMTLLNREDMIKIIETCEVKGQDEAIVRALMYINLGYPIMFYGPPGNGKTTIGEHLLNYISSGDNYYRIEATEGMTEYHTIGGFHPLSMSGNPELSQKFVYKDGIITRAVREHKNLLIDEFNRAPTTAYSGLFMLLSSGILPVEHSEEVLRKPDNWVLIVTANLGDEGTFKMSSSAASYLSLSVILTALLRRRSSGPMRRTWTRPSSRPSWTSGRRPGGCGRRKKSCPWGFPRTVSSR
jgi:MoxR-like ATPase